MVLLSCHLLFLQSCAAPGVLSLMPNEELPAYVRLKEAAIQNSCQHGLTVFPTITLPYCHPTYALKAPIQLHSPIAELQTAPSLVSRCHHPLRALLCSHWLCANLKNHSPRPAKETILTSDEHAAKELREISAAWGENEQVKWWKPNRKHGPQIHHQH